jgi:hypothetical protein
MILVGLLEGRYFGIVGVGKEVVLKLLHYSIRVGFGARSQVHTLMCHGEEPRKRERRVVELKG